jgi:hypothetical protein
MKKLVTRSVGLVTGYFQLLLKAVGQLTDYKLVASTSWWPVIIGRVYTPSIGVLVVFPHFCLWFLYFSTSPSSFVIAPTKERKREREREREGCFSSLDKDSLLNYYYYFLFLF